jgi:hypothetical protein
MEGMSGPSRLARLTEAYDEADGSGAKVLIRRVRVGGPQPDLVARQRAVYDSYSAAPAMFGEDQTVESDDPAEVVSRLCQIVEQTAVDALNVRVQLPGMSPEAVREQIELLGRDVVGPLKSNWPSL